MVAPNQWATLSVHVVVASPHAGFARGTGSGRAYCSSNRRGVVSFLPEIYLSIYLSST